jgi:hypothetical protein
MKSDPTYLIPEEIFLVDNNTRSAQPANTTFQSPGDLPAVTYKTQIGTPFLRVDVIPVFDTADEVATYLEDGIAIAGNIFSYEFSPVWNWFDVWKGTVAYRDGFTKLPTGHYSFLVRALRIRGNRDEEDDWVVSRAAPFRLEYT